MYGQSKQLFDLWVLDNGYEGKVTGLKFFNVFGPNEYHKGEMRSIICKKFFEVNSNNAIRLFKSYNPEYKDGEQKRDFVYVKDAIEVMYYFFTNPAKTGIFNLGTGQASSWNDLARALFVALGRELRIEYVDMPGYIRPQYQYFTQAKLDKLRNSGCGCRFHSLEEAVRDYAVYLKNDGYL
jgi:ADP-L-glycero-D-manno-heptose 6-epimerase